MDTAPICSGCQKPLDPNNIQGLCPECLLKAGLGTGVDIGTESGTNITHARFAAPTPAELAGAFPQLDILELIGQGGMGAVYRVRQKALDRIAALKILPPGIGAEPAFAERFTREAKALARLNHPGIVTLYEFGQTGELFYFIMEFVDGMNLRRLLQAGRVAPREALAIVPQICDALQYAHDQGIVHRDIKPENILLDRLGRVKVADFGLAKLMGSTDAPSGAAAVHDSVALTDAGRIMGTPQYMAPEQSESPTSVDHRADIYSLGVVLYQMLTGELPGKPLQPPSRSVHIDVRLDEVVLRALEQEPQLRYQHVSQIKTAMESISQSPPPKDDTPPKLDWITWAPFQSPRIREICAHMTAAEKHDAIQRARLIGVWIAATCFGPFFALEFMTPPVGWMLAPFIFLMGIIGIPVWRRMQRDFLCSTAWAREHDIKPGQLRISPGISCVGLRGGKAVIHWPGVLLSFLLVLACAESGAIMVAGPDPAMIGISFVISVMAIGFLIPFCLKLPVKHLTPLDGDDESGPVEPKAGAAHRGMAESPRLSRTAIWGAAWAALVPFAALPFIGFTSPPGWKPSYWTIISASVLFALGLASPFATTILGWIAVAQIRRSAGRLYGLGIAVFDGLLFPILIFTGAIMWVSWAAIQLILNAFLDSGLYPGAHLGVWSRVILATLLNYHLTVALLLAIPVAALLNIMAIRNVWRDVNRLAPAGQSTPAAPSPSHANPPSRLGCASILLVIFGIAVVGVSAFLATRLMSRSPSPSNLSRPAESQVRSPASSQPISFPDAAPIETGAQTFGPIIERVVSTSDADDQGLVFFDIETGATLKPPFPLKLFPNQCPYFVEFTPELRQWIKVHDVDILLHLGEKNWEMMTLEMEQDFAGQLAAWDTYTPHQAIAIFAKWATEGRVRTEVPACSGGHDYRDGFGAFDAFRTRSGAIGVYQYEGVQNSTRRGVGFRYKLIQSPPPPYGQTEGSKISVTK